MGKSIVPMVDVPPFPQKGTWDLCYMDGPSQFHRARSHSKMGLEPLMFTVVQTAELELGRRLPSEEKLPESS